jgi:hypothetical protein
LPTERSEEAEGRTRLAHLQQKENRMSDVSIINGVGFAAAGLVLATFCMRSMSALRWVAIASNVAFIAYGYLGGLPPVLLLHTLLLPVNVCRLAQLRSARVRRDPTDERRKGGNDRSLYRALTVNFWAKKSGRRRMALFRRVFRPAAS